MAVYFLRANDTGLIKIGYTRDVRGRSNAVSGGVIGGAVLLGYLPGGRDLEKHLQNRFRKHRRYGEWFVPDAELTEFIELIACRGLPEEQTDKHENLRIREEAHVAEAQQLIAAIVRSMTDRMSDDPALQREAFAGVSQVTGLSAGLLEAIQDNAVEQISAGTLSILRLTAGYAEHFAAHDQQQVRGPGRVDLPGTDRGDD